MAEDRKEYFLLYCKSAKRCIDEVETAMHGGAVLSRRESFDALFKEYVTGYGRMLDVKRGMRRKDKRAAKFYALQFVKTAGWVEDGYTFSSVKSFVNQMLWLAWCKGLSTSIYRATFYDENSVFTIDILNGFNLIHSYTVTDLDSLLEMSISLASFLVSEGESEYKKFFEGYLFQEFGKYLFKQDTKVYVDRRSYALGQVLDRQSAVASNREKSGKVVKYKVG